MNMSDVVSHIILMNGLYNISLPFNEPTENVIQNVIKTSTIKVFSQFAPQKKEHTARRDQLKSVDKATHVYLLPGILTTTPVMYVIDISPEYNPPGRGFYQGIGSYYGIPEALRMTSVASSYAMAIGQARAEPSFEYLGHNKVRLYSFSNMPLTIKVACEHDVNGETIPDSYYSSFLKLAELDTKVFLYNTLKLYDGMASAFGTINLKIDELQSAIQDRETYLEEIRSTFHLDMVEWIEYM